MPRSIVGNWVNRTATPERRTSGERSRLGGILDLDPVEDRAGAHPSIGLAFTLLRFADAETAGMDCVYLENAQGALYQERPSDVDRYTMIFEQLGESALSADESLDLVASYVQRYSGERAVGSAP